MNYQRSQLEAFCASVMAEPPCIRRMTSPSPRVSRAMREHYGMGFVAVPVVAAAASGSSVGAGAGILAAAGGPIGVAIAIGSIVFSILAKHFGPDPRNVPAAQAEQTFEAAALNAENLAKAGMITPDQAAGGMQGFLSMGQQYIQAQQLGKPGQQGISNMTTVIQQIMARTRALPGKITQALNLSQARSYYVSGSNWYAGSTAAGAELTDQFLQTLSPSAGTPQAGGSSLLAASSFPSLGMLAAGALAVYLLTR